MRQSEVSTTDVIKTRAREPLRNIVLLKHLDACPDHTRLHHLSDGTASATLVLLETAASACDRDAYPATRYAALISSDAPGLTLRLLDAVPDDVAVVFKVAGNANGAAIASRFAVRQTAELRSFRSAEPFARDADLVLTQSPGDAAFDLFAAQRHLTPRYQVDCNNTPSVRLAESVGLQRFLAITHFLRLPLADKSAARAQ